MYTALDELPDSIDLAVVTIPAKFVIDLIPRLKEKKYPSHVTYCFWIFRNWR